MNRKISIGIIASIAISMGVFGIIGMSDYTSNDLTNDVPMVKPTQTSTDTSKVMYGPSAIASVIVKDPLEITDRANTMIRGTIVDIKEEVKYLNDAGKIISKSDEGALAQIDVVYYTVDINSVLKGELGDKSIVIRSIFGTYVDYQIGDEIIAMISDEQGEITLNSGPYGMFKIINGKVMGHEKSLDLDTLTTRAQK